MFVQGSSMPGRAARWGLAGLAVLAPWSAHAEELSAGDTAWILISTGLVLFMMIPGLAMFYAGLVRKKNVLSVFMQCFGITAVITILWVAFGYSLAFDPAGMVKDEITFNSFVGGFSKVMLNGITPDTLSGSIPEVVFVVFQMTFAIITPGLIIGAFAERMKFFAVLAFTVLWVTVVYLPVCHMIWGGDGALLWDLGIIDFAGGIVVHITAGAAALVAAIVIGKRKGYPDTPMPPHNMTMTLTGTAMLWVGWFGFNGGSALAANGNAAMAVTVTQISPCVAALVWVVIETQKHGRPSALGLATGAIAGLAAITPAAGTVGPVGAMAIGLVSGALCYVAATTVKRSVGYDDALDVVGVHGVGGLVGILMVAFFASPSLGGFQEVDMGRQFLVQAGGALGAMVYTLIVSFVLLKIVDATIGLRISDDAETRGLDLAEHEEVGYDL